MNGTKPLSFLIAIVCVFVVMLLVALLGPAIFNNPDLELDETGVLRFVYVGVGLLIVFLVYWFTRTSDAWKVGTREVVYMAIGAALYAVFSYLFNGTVFAVPSVSQVALRPAIAIPMFFGYAFGPVVGLFTGAVGNMFGDALTGFSLSPQWSIGNGLVGMVSGMIALYADRKRVMDIVMYISAALAAIATLLWIFNPELSNMMFYDPDAGIFGDATISAFAGLSAVIGFVLVVVVRLLFREDLDRR
ncbi:MAG: ECF transporter S component [Anaerolineales bacterium]